MTVELEGGLYIVVPQALAHGLDVYPGLEEERRVGVTQTVESDRRQCGQSADPALEPSADDIRIMGRTSGPAED